MINRSTNQQGAISGSLIAIIGLIVLVVAAGSLAIWAYVNYNDQKTNVDSKIELAVAEARKDQADADEAKFRERYKEPNLQFVGPENYGRATFDYPKTWSVFVENDGSSGGDFHAYLNPNVVPPISDEQQFALRVTIEQENYDSVVSDYESLVEEGELRASSTSSQGHTGTRFDGSFDEDTRGAAVIYRIRDRTMTIQTDADTFKPDFEKIITTIDFND